MSSPTELKIPKALQRRERLGMLWAPWRMLESEHRDLGSALRRYRHWLRRIPPPPWERATLERWGTMLDFLKTRTYGHFKIEEQIVFPYLRRCRPSLGPDLRRLQQEHVAFRRAFASLTRLHRRPLSPAAETRAALQRRRQSLRVIALLERHARHEQRLMRRRPHAAFV